MENKRIAVIRISGRTGLKKDIKDTLNMMRLYNKCTCTVLPNTSNITGMINKVKECTTWGEIDEETLNLLLTKRGKLARKKKLTDEYTKEKLKVPISDFTKKIMKFELELKELPGLKLFFKLSPPRGGFEKGGIKKQFAQGGVVGYRKDRINDLLKRMI